MEKLSRFLSLFLSVCMYNSWMWKKKIHRVQQSISFRQIHLYIYMYIYIYMNLCIYVCMYSPVCEVYDLIMIDMWKEIDRYIKINWDRIRRSVCVYKCVCKIFVWEWKLKFMGHNYLLFLSQYKYIYIYIYICVWRFVCLIVSGHK